MSVKTSQVLVGLVLAGAVVGLAVGTRGTRVTSEARRQTLYQRAQAGAAESSHPSAAPAAAWRDLPASQRGPNATFVNHLDKMAQVPPEPEVLEGRAARLAGTRVARAERRAYDGAPPRVPHTIDERGTSACLACHVDGFVVAGRIAPRMSHPLYQNCTQCHVSVEAPWALEPAPDISAGNSFVGLGPSPGTRFMPGAPPVMPHSLWMRDTCASCHGPLGPPGLRTTHPERQSCEQCHAPGPSLLQEVFFP